MAEFHGRGNFQSFNASVAGTGDSILFAIKISVCRNTYVEYLHQGKIEGVRVRLKRKALYEGRYSPVNVMQYI